MKKITLLLFILISIQTKAQAPSWAWAKCSTNINSSNWPKKTVIDSQNNIYILGRFNNLMNFENITLYGTNDSRYLIKLNPLGNLIWAKKIEIGTVFNYEITFLKLDNNDKIILGGYVGLNTFSGSINYNDEVTINFEPTPNLGNQRYFSINLYPITGSVNWYDTDYGKSSLYSGDIDNLNNYYLFGEYRTSILVEGTQINSTTPSDTDFYILKKNNNNLSWIKPFNFYCIVDKPIVKVINNQNIIIVAKTYSENFAYQNNSVQMENPNVPKLIILKLDLEGNFISLNYINNYPDFQNASTEGDFHIDDFGNVFIYGTFVNNNIQIGTTTLNKIGAEDLYIAKFNSNAVFLMARNIGVQNISFFDDCLTTHNGNIIIGADFSPSGNMSINNTNYICNGGYTTLLINLDSNFNYNWTKTATGIGNQLGNNPSAINFNNQNDIIVSGVFDCQNIAFDNFNLLPLNTTSSGLNTFVAKLNNNNLSIDEFNSKSFTLYPNPVKDTFTISGVENLKGINYFITDTSGRIINKGTISDNSNFLIEVNNLKKGIYFFSTNNGYNQKFIKE
jgi:hypothetical protein